MSEPRCIGKYKIVQEIGRGGFAVVYKAHDPSLDRVVALKVLHPYWGEDPTFATRFRNEARAAANLRHSNIVTVYETGEAAGQLYIAMEYLSGRTLRELLEAEGALSLERALPILEQMADALDYAHGQGVIHRDVKPANVMVEETLRGVHATLMDFGLVKAMEGSAALTSQGTLLGSPEYMAPEQADPARAAEIGPAADRYALGILAYQMLTGRVPFPGNTPATLNAHEHKPVPPPRSLRADLPEAVEVALLKMLAKVPDERFTHAQVFTARLREALQAESRLRERQAQLGPLYAQFQQAVTRADWAEMLASGRQIMVLDAHYRDVPALMEQTRAQLRRPQHELPRQVKPERKIPRLWPTWVWGVLGAVMIIACVVGLVSVVPSLLLPVDTPRPPTVMPTEPPKPADPSAAAMAKLYEAAKAESALSTIALPDDWLNYGEIKKTFFAKYPALKYTDLFPDAGSQDEVNAINANKDNKGPQNPDVVDVGFASALTLKNDGLCMPYKVATWDSIPTDLKDPDGCWYGDYYGVISFAVNKAVVKTSPQDWADLLKPDYRNMIAIAGDPLASYQAQQSVYAAGLANGGTLDNVAPGLDFFVKLVEAGNLVPVIGDPSKLAKGETPILITWDFLALLYKDILKGNPEIEVVVPKSFVFGTVYFQAINKYSPRPNAAKLWMEYLYSDEGQLLWLKGYGHPIRYDDLVKRNVIPADLAAKLPPAEMYAKAVFPTVAQVAAARKYVGENWEKVVGVKIAK